MRYIINLLFFVLIVSCTSKTDIFFKTPDEFTGGFNTFYLHLVKSGDLELKLESFKSMDQSETGVSWELRSKVFRGHWSIKNKVIEYQLNEKNDSIYSFLKSTDNDFTDKNILTFSKSLDTAYILGIPAIKINSTNH